MCASVPAPRLTEATRRCCSSTERGPGSSVTRWRDWGTENSRVMPSIVSGGLQRTHDRLSGSMEADRAGWSTVRTSLKALTATATAALLVAGLAACSSSSAKPSSTSTTAATACQNVKSGSTSKSVKVTGDFGTDPTVKFTAPLKVSGTQRSVVITGKGAKTTSGETLGLGLAAYNGTTGKAIAPSEGYGTGSPVTAKIDDKSFLPGFVRAAECLPVGSRSVLTTDAQGAFGSSYAQLGVKKTDPIVIVT